MADNNSYLTYAAFGMSVVALGWHVWTYFHNNRRLERHREEERQAKARAKSESIRATANFEPVGNRKVFAVEVFNDGEVSIYLREVRLNWSKNGQTHSVRLHRRSGQKADECLPEHKSEWWTLWRADMDALPHILSLPTDHVEVVITSHGGQVGRLSGAEVQPLLAEVMASWGDELGKSTSVERARKIRELIRDKERETSVLDAREMKTVLDAIEPGFGWTVAEIEAEVSSHNLDRGA